MRDAVTNASSPPSTPETLCVRDIMTSMVMTLKPDDGGRLAVQMMLWGGIRHLPVVEDGRVVGLVTDRDLHRAHTLDAHAYAKPVRELMVEEPETVGVDEPVAIAARRMADAHIGCLPVLDGQSLAGIVTSSDVLACIAQDWRVERPPPAHTVGDVMCQKPHVVTADMTLSDAVGTMVEQGIRHLPVVGREGTLVGIMSDRDVRAAVGDPISALREGGANMELRVEDVMTANPVAVNVADDLEGVAKSFLDERIGAVPVIDADDRVVGVVSYVDVLHCTLASMRARA